MKRDKEIKKFCEVYLQTMDPAQAAKAAGWKDGYSALEEEVITKRLSAMRQQHNGQIQREDVVRRLAHIAFSDAADALQLALAPREAAPEGLDLAAVAEFKVTEKGVEMKLVDRIEALEALYRLQESRQEQGVETLYRAINSAVGNPGQVVV